MNIDPNKIITPFVDCEGTCKTPVGCTCGKMDNDKVVGVEMKVDTETGVDLVAEESKKSILAQEPKKQCNCGKNNGGVCLCASRNKGCGSGTHKLEVYNWLGDMPGIMVNSQMVEVQFKNTRKGYYLNSNNLEIFKGDIVAVEATPGHDIGEVTLTGKLVELQMKKANYRGDVKRVYRIAKPNDIEKYEASKAKEHKTMLRAREIAEELKLDMKISDVEFQGDGNKAIFYYIADGRVDFRQLIKVYASEFRVKIEMKQIGARQEAGRVGGIGPCGRELCCSSSMSNFVSVSTSAARLQDIPLNPQKLAGQCGKLKCCLNFEADTYVEAQKKLPSRDIVLETKDGAFFHFKTDILSGMMTYSTDKHFAANLVTLPRSRVFDIIKQNRRGEKPLTLIDHELIGEPVESKSLDVLEQESITRFDKNGKNDARRKKGRNNSNNKKPNGNNGNADGGKQLSKPTMKKAKKEGEEKKTQNTETTSVGEQQPAKKKRRTNNNNKPSNRNRPDSKPNQNKGDRNENNENKQPKV